MLGSHGPSNLPLVVPTVVHAFTELGLGVKGPWFSCVEGRG